MGQVTLVLNGRSYRLSCRAGEEDRLRLLAGLVQKKLDKLVAEFGQAGEPRLLLMSAIMIADELLDARAERDAAVESAAEALRNLALLSGAPKDDGDGEAETAEPTKARR